VRELLDTLDAWQAAGLDVGRAVVVRTFASAPLPAGATLIAAADGRIAGSVSGGCVEGAVATALEEARATGLARVIRYGISDDVAWDVGLACGGTIDVLVEPHVPAAAVAAARAQATDDGSGRCVVTPLPEGAPGPDIAATSVDPGSPPAPPLVVDGDGSVRGSLGSEAADAALRDGCVAALASGESGVVSIEVRQLFVEAFPVRPRLVIIGAVQASVALTRMARELGFRTAVVDGRPAFVSDERFPDADQVFVGWPDEAAEALGLGPPDAVAILTHDPKFDEPAIVEAIRRGCRYVGAMGSRRTQKDRRERLRERGLTDEDIDRVRGPIGLDLGGRAGAETALAILAEVVAERRGGSGVPMSERARAAPP
jgi:xanthine dehydrogenase accessory factor